MVPFLPLIVVSALKMVLLPCEGEAYATGRPYRFGAWKGGVGSGNGDWPAGPRQHWGARHVARPTEANRTSYRPSTGRRRFAL